MDIKGRKKSSNRDARTPDVRLTKKKLSKYMAKETVTSRDKRPDLTDDLGLGGQLVDGADSDFITLLAAEASNERAQDELLPGSRGGSRGKQFSRMSGVSAVSGLSGVTAVTDMSDGSSLRWKTGMMRRRKEKAAELREQWVESVKPSQHNYVGGDGEYYETVEQPKLGYELPF